MPTTIKQFLKSDNRDILSEALVTFPRGGQAKYNQVVFLGGGMASGKDFALENFIDSSTFKVFDVDRMKTAIQSLAKIGKLSMKDLQEKVLAKLPKDYHSAYIAHVKAGHNFDDLDMSKPENATILHFTHKVLRFKDKFVENMLNANMGSQNKPNIMFNVAMKAGDMTEIADFLKKVGYKPEDIHLVWVFIDTQEAITNNLSRDRVAPEDMLLHYHKIVKENITKIIKNREFKTINGEIYIILNKRVNTEFYKSSGKTSSFNKTFNKDKFFKKVSQDFTIKSFKYIYLKKRGKGINAGEALKNYEKAVLNAK